MEKMKKSNIVFSILLGVASIIWHSSSVEAGIIQQFSSASTNLGELTVGSLNNAINQSGLINSYTSAVTDFDTYVATDPRHSFTGDWQSNNITTGNVDFALGGSLIIESFLLWNRGGGSSLSVNSFELFAANDASFAGATSLGVFNASANVGSPTAIGAEVFGFTPTTASFLRMQINSNHGNTIRTGFQEAAVEVQSMEIPEPTTLALFSIGLAGLGFAQRRRRRPDINHIESI